MITTNDFSGDLGSSYNGQIGLTVRLFERSGQLSKVVVKRIGVSEYSKFWLTRQLAVGVIQKGMLEKLIVHNNIYNRLKHIKIVKKCSDEFKLHTFLSEEFYIMRSLLKKSDLDEDDNKEPEISRLEGETEIKIEPQKEDKKKEKAVHNYNVTGSGYDDPCVIL